MTEARHIYAHDVQYGATFAVDAVVQYLQELDIDPQLCVPLIGLSGALVDAGMGITNPHVSLAKHEGGTKTPIQDSLTWGWAAAAVTLQLEAGETLPSAARRVHAILGNRFPVSKIIEYRKRLTRGKSTVREQSRSNYHTAIGSAHAEKQLSPRQRAEWTLTTLRNMTGTKQGEDRTKVR
ncbi:hypothetical protein [Mesorhizobium muleiense]|uniref:hypothetical protein n=1 Tax=Mesorhizobium muleiense TaxID=1004279 RepID=UPI001113F09F|nr:hypothetical protein [Mesorhizobium muleiense]MCF6099822.1 hypothetical protein [Mesorhizobium muleiense]